MKNETNKELIMTAAIAKSSVDQSKRTIASTEANLRRRRRVSIAVFAIAALGTTFTALALIDWAMILANPTSRWGLSAVFYLLLGAVMFLVLRGLRRLPGKRTAAETLDDAANARERFTTLATLRGDHHSRQLASHVAEEATDLQRQQSSTPVHRELVFDVAGIGLVVVALAVLTQVSGSGAYSLTSRLLVPWSSAKLTRLQTEDIASIVVRGTPIQFESVASGRIPSEGKLLLRSSAGVVREFTLTGDSETGSFSHEMKRAQKSFGYRWKIGDAETQWRDVTVVDNPKITRLAMKVSDPEYTDRPPSTWTRLPRKIKALRQSNLQMDFDVDHALENAVVSIEPIVARGNEAPSPALISLVESKPNQFHFQTELTEPCRIRLELTGPTGLKTQRGLVIEIQKDAPPKVFIAASTDDIALTKDDVLQIDYRVKDDFGIDRAELKLTRTALDGSREEITRPLDIEKFRGKQEFSDSIELDLAELDIQPGEELQYEIEVSDLGGEKSQSENLMSENAADPAQPQFFLTQEQFEKLTELNNSVQQQMQGTREQDPKKANADQGTEQTPEERIAELAEEVEDLTRSLAESEKSMNVDPSANAKTESASENNRFGRHHGNGKMLRIQPTQKSVLANRRCKPANLPRMPND